MRLMWADLGAQWNAAPTAIAEYVPDVRYDTSKDYCVIALVPENATVPFNIGARIANTRGGSSISMHAEFQGTTKRFDHVRTLLRYHKRTDDAGVKYYDYAPVLLFSNGIEKPFVYHQINSATGEFEVVESIDGGDSDITYLGDVPRGKYMTVFKERLFMFNVEGAGNRYFHTGPHESGVWCCNVWPSEYNADIGAGGEEITAVKVFRDVQVIFKEGSIWVLSGDGVDGVWNIQQVDGLNGALEWCVEDVGDALIFANRSGVFAWSGGLAKRISHPHLEKLWPDLQFSGITQTGFDPERRLFFLSTGFGLYGAGGHQILVYDLLHQAWTRWGTWRGDDGVPQDFGHVTMFARLDKFLDRPILAFAKSEYLCMWGGDFDDGGTAGTAPIHWLIRSQPFQDKQWRTAMARRITLDAEKTGLWNVWALVTVDGEGPVDAMRRRSAGKWNLIMDSANLASHAVNGQSQFMRSADGPVDVLFFPGNRKIGDSLPVVDSTDPDKMVFRSDLSSIGMAGFLLVVPEDTSGVVQFSMADGDTMGEPTGDTVYQEPRFTKQSMGCNAIGRVFEVYLSNVGDPLVPTGEGGLPNYGKYAIEGMPFRARGWGLWLVPTAGVRP